MNGLIIGFIILGLALLANMRFSSGPGGWEVEWDPTDGGDGGDGGSDGGGGDGGGCGGGCGGGGD